MSIIEELIQEICPEGVEYKSVGEICETVTDYVAAGSFADLAKNVKYNRKIDYAQLIRTTDLKSKFNRDGFIYISENAYNYLWRVNLNEESIILPNIGNCGEVYYIVPEDLPHKKNVLGPNAILVRSNSNNNRFLSHLFLSEEFQRKLKKITSASGQTKFNKTELKRLTIPVPPLPIQHEIVSILDKFTQLEAELEAELEARSSQYKFYRDQLLNFEGKDVKWKTLGEVGEFVRGSGMQKSDFTESGVGCIHYGQIYTYYGFSADKTKTFVSPELAKKLRKAKNGDIIIATTSENIEDVCKTVVWLGREEIAISGETYILRHNQNAKYIAYYLQTPTFQDFKQQNRTGTKVIRVHGEKLKKFKIPIPPLAEQERIVAILDKFDALVNDISVGLPAEITARRKQYEYYRGKLLNFKPIIHAEPQA